MTDASSNSTNSEISIEKLLDNLDNSLNSDDIAKQNLTAKMATSEQVLAKAMEIFATSIKPPQFSTANPQVWFANLEAQFSISSIKVGTTKLQHVVAALPANVNDIFRHITCKSSFEDGDYDKLKSEIIAYFGESKKQRTDQILEMEQMGDRTPSQFWLALKAKAFDLTMTDDLLFHCWLKRLPAEIQSNVSGLKSKYSIEELLVVANDMYEQSKSNASVAAIANNQHSHNCCSVTPSRSSSPKRNPSPRRRSFSSNRGRPQNNGYQEDGPYCWYHYTFGKRAHKCNKDNCLAKKSGNGPQ